MSASDQIFGGALGILASQAWWMRALIGGFIGAVLFVSIPPLFNLGNSGKPQQPAAAQSVATADHAGVAISGNQNHVYINPSQSGDTEVARRNRVLGELFQDFFRSHDGIPTQWEDIRKMAAPYINKRLVERGEAWRFDGANDRILEPPIK